MELTAEQVEILFAFTRKKYVHWYDLQAEVVDHLASRIEECSAKDPSLSFETALQKVYKEFGLFGFAHIVKEKQAQLQRSSRRTWWAAFRSFFRWPHGIGLLAALLLLWQVTHLLPVWVALFLLIGPYLVSEGQLLWLRRKQRRLARPLLLLELSPLRFTAGFFYLQLAVNVNGHWSHTGLFVLGVITLLCVLVNRASIAGHQRVQREAETLYPEAFVPAG
ncbi:hypothetical protein [Flaviaesturariibacter aridisoli]|uniref:Uncharacterized protein n=1 Tax=Flaviaesturariibacter aridisoli TaxID=2545761 RepID=A0A4R4DV40_9BACT|nr:hypothetical protein [Flaviaesturariibacter aridisoli]TCZ67191.1 hypothetical protein E0486_16065 [Flaviaesturariibacter aridisoli]